MSSSETPISTRPSPSGASLPDGMRVYVLGDIHGRADLLKDQILGIGTDIKERPIAMPLLVCLGDYIDRGPDSFGVIELLLRAGRLLPTICLAGNHELYALRFLRDAGGGRRWLDVGGKETLISYGVAPPINVSKRALTESSEAFAMALPKAHRNFLANLATTLCLGDYVFVHAGLEADRAVAEQNVEVVTTIREPFLTRPVGFGRVVVHGHTPIATPEIGKDRINIDTAAYATGVLTCAVLEAATLRFL